MYTQRAAAASRTACCCFHTRYTTHHDDDEYYAPGGIDYLCMYVASYMYVVFFVLLRLRVGGCGSCYLPRACVIDNPPAKFPYTPLPCGYERAYHT